MSAKATWTQNVWGMIKHLLNHNVWIRADDGAPVNGTTGTGAGIAGPGSIYIDYTNAIIYSNTGTLASPTWTAISGASGNVTLNGTQTLTNKTLTAPILTGTTAAATIAASAGVTSSGGGIGYATGAGGTVTQTTSKTTGVTCSHLSGAVTTSNAALDPNAIVSFVMTNSFIAATDVLVLNHISGGTPGSYHLNARAAAGSATLDITNLTAGTLSEAIVIQYAVIKAVNT